MSSSPMLWHFVYCRPLNKHTLCKKVLNQQYHTVNVVQQQVWWKNSLLWQERFFCLFVCLFVCFFVFVALGLYVTQWGKGEVGKLVT